MSTLEHFFELAWERYARVAPDAHRIHALLEARGERIVNDHVAFRTFDLPGVDRITLGQIFETSGYVKATGDLDFPDKKLTASYWVHPEADRPRVFVSELRTADVEPELAEWVRGFASQAVRKFGPQPGPEIFLQSSWDPVRLDDYRRFYPLSEYAAWTAAFGIQANHFTISFNSLKTFSGLTELNAFLKQSDFTLNGAGGEIKGTPSDLLEQSSTQARKVPWPFAGGVTAGIPGCYYEFARRYPIPGTDQLFQGFIPASADRIFESTYDR